MAMVVVTAVVVMVEIMAAAMKAGMKAGMAEETRAMGVVMMAATVAVPVVEATGVGDMPAAVPTQSKPVCCVVAVHRGPVVVSLRWSWGG